MERYAERVRLWCTISWLGRTVGKRRTVSCVENRNSSCPWYFPKAMASVLHYQKLADWWWLGLTGYRELALTRIQIVAEKSSNVDDLADLSGLNQSGPHSDHRSQLGDRRNISVYAYLSMHVRSQGQGAYWYWCSTGLQDRFPSSSNSVC